MSIRQRWPALFALTFPLCCDIDVQKLRGIGERMEIFGGFMVMMSIIGFFLAVIWLIMPFVVFAIKGKQDRTVEVMERIEKRLEEMNTRLAALQHVDRPAVAEPSARVSDITPQDQDRADDLPAS
jgi:hypothetical protein